MLSAFKSSTTSSSSSTSTSQTQSSKPGQSYVKLVTKTVQVRRSKADLERARDRPNFPSSSYHGLAAKAKKRSRVSRSREDDGAKRRKVERNGDVRPSSDAGRKRKPMTVQSESEDSDGDDDEEEGSGSSRRARDIIERDVAAEGDGNVEGVVSAEDLVKKNLDAYNPFFHDPSDPSRSALEWSGSEYPTVSLEYPAEGASEKYILLHPKDNDDFHPVIDVINVIRTTLDHYLTPEQSSSHFLHTPTSLNPAFAFLSRSLPLPTSRDQTPLSDPGTPSSDDRPKSDSSTTALNEPIMRSLERARHKKDGPGFRAAVERFNEVMRRLKSEGVIRKNIQGMKGVEEAIWARVGGQIYERTVGPRVDDLGKGIKAFSDNVYGELLPRFVSEIIKKTNVGPKSVFVDLGSGVGNCLIQASLQAGCESFGCEIMPLAASLAADQLVQTPKRWRMWGLRGGSMTAVEADFTESLEVGNVLKRADVVLVNNYVFTPATNDRLSLLFLELPNGAQIVSLKPFVPSDFRITERTAGSPLAILDQSPAIPYGSRSVSWTDEGGVYYIAKVDRSRIARWTRGS